MKSTPDLPLDPWVIWAPPIKPATPPAPDPVKAFEHINDQSTAIQTVADTLRKKQAAAPVPADPVVTGWDFGLDLTALMAVTDFPTHFED